MVAFWSAWLTTRQCSLVLPESNTQIKDSKKSSLCTSSTVKVTLACCILLGSLAYLGCRSLGNGVGIIAKKIDPSQYPELAHHVDRIASLNPNSPQDALKILVDDRDGIFNISTCEANKQKYILGLFRKTAVHLHTDKCPEGIKDICTDAFTKLNMAKKLCLELPCDVKKNDEEIRSLDFKIAVPQLINSYFPFIELSEDMRRSEWGCFLKLSKEEMQRRISLLSTQQVTALIERFGLNYFPFDGIELRCLHKLLGTDQKEHALRHLDYSRLDGESIENTILWTSDKQLKERVSFMNSKQIEAIMKNEKVQKTPKQLFLQALTLEQRKECGNLCEGGDPIQTMDDPFNPEALVVKR